MNLRAVQYKYLVAAGFIVGDVHGPHGPDDRERRAADARTRSSTPANRRSSGSSPATCSASRSGSRHRAGSATASARRRCSSSRCSMFTLASALCGLSWNIGSLIAFRILQGVGGGMMTPVGMAMLFRAFPPQERARASLILTVPTVIAPAHRPDHRRLARSTTSTGAGSSTSTCRSASPASSSACSSSRSTPKSSPVASTLPGFVLSGAGPRARPLRALPRPDRWLGLRAGAEHRHRRARLLRRRSSSSSCA